MGEEFYTLLVLFLLDILLVSQDFDFFFSDLIIVQYNVSQLIERLDLLSL